MKTAGLSWAEVREHEGENVIEVYCSASSMVRGRADTLDRILDGCELVHLTKAGYQVTRWPEDAR